MSYEYILININNFCSKEILENLSNEVSFGFLNFGLSDKGELCEYFPEINYRNYS